MAEVKKRKSENDVSEHSDQNGDCKKPKPSEEPNFTVKGYHANRKGEREDMQDAHVIINDLREFVKSAEIHACSRMAYYAVFDGHAGVRASHFAADNLHQNWANTIAPSTSLSTLEQNLKRCFIEAYKKTDEQFLNEAVKAYVNKVQHQPVWKDGTTATALFIIGDALYVTNLGDSAAVLCRHKPEEDKNVAIILTKDHNPTVFEERMRIQKAGGIVKDGRIMGVLEVSRSIGDGQFKKHGVTCIPDIKKCTLLKTDRYVLIGCDGLWKSFRHQEALDFIAQTKRTIWNDEKIVRAGEKSLNDVRWETVCNQLAAEAVRKGSGDNVTVLIVVLNLDQNGNSCDEKSHS